MTRLEVQGNKSRNDVCKNVKLVAYTCGLLFILTACDSVNNSVNIKENIGYFVSDFNKDIDYTCENKRQHMSENGRFKCTSFPISFYMDEVKIGQISTIHRDGYVYPQDIIILEDNVPIYSSEGNMKFLFIE